MKIDILKILEGEEPIVPNRISGMANINYVELLQMLSELETKGFLTVKAIGKSERLYKRLVYKTEEGARVIREYESLLEKLGEIA